VQNPFVSFSSPFSSSLKLSLPDSYKQVEKDDHGKGNMAFLDTIFDFLDFRFVASGGLLVDDDMPTTFTKELRTNLVASLAINEYFENIFENRGEDHSFFSENQPRLNDHGTSPGGEIILELCQGDCDTDDDCAEGLECFQRDGEEDNPPGCSGTPKKNYDYCVAEKEGPILNVIQYFYMIDDLGGVLLPDQPLIARGSYGTNHGAGTLQLCEGDCDDNNDCAEGLICFKRNGLRNVPPGCTGTPQNHWDYCVAEFPEFPVDFVLTKLLKDGRLEGSLNVKTKKWFTERPTLAEPKELSQDPSSMLPLQLYSEKKPASVRCVRTLKDSKIRP